MNANLARDNEENDLLQNLVDERQRAQELEEELERLQKNSRAAFNIGHDQTSKLKQFIHLLKKKYDDIQLLQVESQKQVSSFTEKCTQLEISNNELACENEQLKTGLEQTECELQKLQLQWQKAKKIFAENEEELELLKEQLIKLKELLKEKEECNQTYIDENKCYKQKQLQFERVIYYLRKRIEETRLDNKELSETLHVKEQQLLAVKQGYQRSCGIRQSLEKEIARLSLHNQQHQSGKEKADKQSDKTIAKQLSFLKETKQQFAILQERIETNLEEYKKEKEQQWLQQTVFGHKVKYEKLDSSLKTAQQHLAKNVREAALLNEEKLALQQSLTETKNALERAHFKLLESQNQLEIECQNQKLLQDQYQSSLKAVELRAIKWEEKHFELQQKRREAEEKLCEFKLFEERYQKMNKILSDLSSLLNTAFSVEYQDQSLDAVEIAKISPRTVTECTDSL
ncbi:MAG: hypothetical protein ACSNEK_03345 [Parachlamydiaceae bacterium]